MAEVNTDVDKNTESGCYSICFRKVTANTLLSPGGDVSNSLIKKN